MAAMRTSVAESIPSERTARLPEMNPMTIFEKARATFPHKAIQLAFFIEELLFSMLSPPRLEDSSIPSAARNPRPGRGDSLLVPARRDEIEALGCHEMIVREGGAVGVEFYLGST